MVFSEIFIRYFSESSYFYHIFLSIFFRAIFEAIIIMQASFHILVLEHIKNRKLVKAKIYGKSDLDELLI